MARRRPLGHQHAAVVRPVVAEPDAGSPGVRADDAGGHYGLDARLPIFLHRPVAPAAPFRCGGPDRMIYLATAFSPYEKRKRLDDFCLADPVFAEWPVVGCRAARD